MIALNDKDLLVQFQMLIEALVARYIINRRPSVKALNCIEEHWEQREVSKKASKALKNI